MAGILYLMRLFVYHAAETESIVKERFKLMEQRLYRIITIPAMVVALVLGIAMLVINPSLPYLPWMQLKLVLVLLLMAVTIYAKKLKQDLATGTCSHSDKFFRVLNEVPTLLMIGIVFLVILRPF